MSELAELLERVKAATGADRELDARLRCFVDPFEEPYDALKKQGYADAGIAEGHPSYTASIDDALALVERVLPGAVWHVMTDYGDLNRAKIGPSNNPSASIYSTEDRGLFAQGDAATPPLAIVLALLSALSQQEAK